MAAPLSLLGKAPRLPLPGSAKWNLWNDVNSHYVLCFWRVPSHTIPPVGKQEIPKYLTTAEMSRTGGVDIY